MKLRIELNRIKLALNARARWAVYGVALLGTLAAIRWVNGLDHAQAEIAAAPPAAQSAPAQQTQQAQAGAMELPQRPYNAPKNDPFGSRSWDQLEAEEARKNMPPPPPPKPEAPPLPFRYMGRLIEGEKITVFLNRGQTNYIAHAGDVLNGTYRVTHIGDDRMTLVYLPLGIEQQLTYGSSGGGGAAPAAPRAAPRDDDEDEEEERER